MLQQHDSYIRNDEFAWTLINYTMNLKSELGEGELAAARRILTDSLAVSFNGLEHPAAKAARRYAKRYGYDAFIPGRTARVWGTDRESGVEAATLANGSLLRCYDYNDLHRGRSSGGHPSDMVAGLITVADSFQRSGEVLITSLVIAYEVLLSLFDVLPIAKNGWEYSPLAGIAVTCGIARMLDLDPLQLREALAITVIPRGGTHEIDSNELNHYGDLSMWKRFNGADAIRHSLYACLLAQVGVEGVVRPFVGEEGFLAQFADGIDPSEDLKLLLDPSEAPSRIGQTTLKLWPVGSRAQSTIDAILAARKQLPDGSGVESVRVYADKEAFHHFIELREDPYHPNTSETADHSYPYIIAAAALDGNITNESFALSRVLEPRIQEFLANSITIEVDDDSSEGGRSAGYPASVEIVSTDGGVYTGKSGPPPGHPDNPISDDDIRDKFLRHASDHLGANGAQDVFQMLSSIEQLPDVRELTLKLVSSRRIDD